MVADEFEVPLDSRGAEEGQPMQLGMIGGMLSKFWDPDWQFVSELGGGPDRGGRDMPCTPLVFDGKTKWSLEELQTEGDKDRENYKSAEGMGEGGGGAV